MLARSIGCPKRHQTRQCLSPSAHLRAAALHAVELANEGVEAALLWMASKCGIASVNSRFAEHSSSGSRMKG